MLFIVLAAALAVPPPPTLSTRVRDPAVIRAAVDAALVREEQSTAAETSERANGDTILRSAEYRTFSRNFAEARVPDCLHPDALKNQFTPIGGIYSAPFVLLAKLRGKCN